MRLRALLIFIFISSHVVLLSQQSAYIQYDTKDGLAQSQVRAIEQDSHGYLWFGTVGGLSSFDGYDFHTFSTDDGLPANQINCLFESNGNLWIGSTGSLCRRNALGFTSFPMPDAYANSKIFDLAEDKEGNIWLALAGEGLLKYDGDKFLPFKVKDGLPNEYLRSIAVAPNGDLWVGSREGIALIKDGAIRKPPFPELEKVSIADILFTLSGKTIVCTFGDGVFIIEDNEIHQFTVSDGLPSNMIRCVIELPNGELWFGAKEGLTKLENGKFSVFRESQGLPYSNVKSLGKDREGNLWIGTDGKGVLMQAGRSFTSYSTKDGLHSDLAMDICKTDTGSLVFGSYDSGLAVYNGTEFIEYAYNDKLPGSTVWVLESDEQGNLWAGTSQGLYHEKRGETYVLTHQNGLPGIRVTALLKDESAIWAGAENGFAKVDKNGMVVEVHSDSTGFKGKRIRSLEKLNGDLWIGAEGSVYKYSKEQFTEIEIDSTGEKPVYCIKQDSYNKLWVGTSNGLYNLDPENNRLSRVEFNSGFASRNINFLTNLADSTLLIGTNNGLYRLELASFYKNGEIKSKHYTNYEGLISGETNQNAVYYDGEVVWFGTTSGAVKFNPYRDSYKIELPPALNLTQVQLFLQSTDWLEMSDTISTQTGLPVDPVLKYDNNYLTFYYAGANFTNPDKVRYRYRLAGADEKWLGPTESRSVTYAYLPHGDYSFLLESYSIDEPDLVSSLNFDFIITPPFYLRPWFFVLVGILVIALFYAIVLSRVKKEQQKRATLQLQFQSRLMALESQTLNSSMNRHFIFNALNSIQYYINMQDRKSANRYLTSFAKLIRKNLDSSQQNETSLADELERIELYLSLEQMRFQDRFDYAVHIDSEINTETVEIPAMILQPFLENSIWHGILPTEAHGKINLNITNHQTEVVIEIRDNGIGVETSMRNKNGSEETHISKGMEITHNRIQLYRKMTGLNYLLEGPTELVNAEGVVEGTTVLIRLPKG